MTTVGTDHAYPIAGYDPGEDCYDEAFAGRGVPREHYREALAALAGGDVGAMRSAMAQELAALGVTFGEPGRRRPFAVDPVPRIVTAGEWAELEAGLVQRVRALEAFVADVYGERAIVAAGLVPARVIESCDHQEPLLHGLQPPGGTWIGVAGLDVVRDPRGCWLVLEDNLRTPSGLAYAVAARQALDGQLPSSPPAARRSLDDAVGALARTLRAADPSGQGDPAIALLSDGPASSAWFEHRALAHRLDVELASPRDLEASGGRLFLRRDGRRRALDVVYRRTDEDRLVDARGGPTLVGGLLLEPWRLGNLAVVNGFGTGVADDKLAHAYVEQMIRFYLAQEPLLASVPTYDLGRPEVREDVLGRLDQLVIKPRSGHGGHGVLIGAHARPADRARTAAAVRARPDGFVAQEMIMLSRHPTLTAGRLEPRHVDLRPFVFGAAGQVTVAPGGLTRVAMEPGALVVNSSQAGGAKDTWVLRDVPVR